MALLPAVSTGVLTHRLLEFSENRQALAFVFISGTSCLIGIARSLFPFLAYLFSRAF